VVRSAAAAAGFARLREGEPAAAVGEPAAAVVLQVVQSTPKKEEPAAAVEEDAGNAEPAEEDAANVSNGVLVMWCHGDVELEFAAVATKPAEEMVVVQEIESLVGTYDPITNAPFANAVSLVQDCKVPLTLPALKGAFNTLVISEAKTAQLRHTLVILESKTAQLRQAYFVMQQEFLRAQQEAEHAERDALFAQYFAGCTEADVDSYAACSQTDVDS
jgi:hypothetical protein